MEVEKACLRVATRGGGVALKGLLARVHRLVTGRVEDREQRRVFRRVEGDVDVAGVVIQAPLKRGVHLRIGDRPCGIKRVEVCALRRLHLTQQVRLRETHDTDQSEKARNSLGHWQQQPRQKNPQQCPQTMERAEGTLLPQKHTRAG